MAPTPGRAFVGVSGWRYPRWRGDFYPKGLRHKDWAADVRGWLADGLDTYVYFDNDGRGHAPHDAVSLIARLT